MHRVFTWIIIILIFSIIGGGIYHYLSVRAAKINTSQGFLTNSLVAHWTLDRNEYGIEKIVNLYIM